MNNYPDKLELDWWPDLGKVFSINSPFRYITNDGTTITVPSGFKTNLTNLLKHDRHSGASAIHDCLYETEGCFIDQDGNGRTFSRFKCDEIFLEACINAGLKKRKAYFMFVILVLFGWRRWGKTN